MVVIGLGYGFPLMIQPVLFYYFLFFFVWLKLKNKKINVVQPVLILHVWLLFIDQGAIRNGFFYFFFGEVE